MEQLQAREHPIRLVNDDDLRRSRVTVFFRLLLAISWESPLLTFRPYRYLSHPVSSLATYQAWLNEGLRTIGWT